MAKLKSPLMAYFINTGSSGSPDWATLGKGITSLPFAMNPQTTTETYINEDNANTSVDSYQASIALDITLWDASTAPAHAYLKNLRDTFAVAADAETEILEIDLNTTSPYTARLYSVAVAPDTYTLTGGSPQTLSVTIYVNGSPTVGTATIAAGTPTFTPTSVSAIALTTVPDDEDTGVVRTSAITLTFNNPIKTESVSLATAAGDVVAFTKAWNAARTVLVLTPSSTMAASTVHLLTVAGVSDVYGQALATTVHNFTTAS